MQKIQVNNNYAIVIDDWYSDEEYNQVFQECKFASYYLRDPDKSGAAANNFKLIKKNKAIFIPDLFADFNTSVIGKLSNKLYNSDLVDSLINQDMIYYYLKECNHHNCLLSYYEEDDYYQSHRDSAVITMVTWLYEKPKSFKGGNLVLKDDNNTYEIECLSNRSVLFPSFMQHAVTPIIMNENDLNQNLGRFTISQFSLI